MGSFSFTVYLLFFALLNVVDWTLTIGYEKRSKFLIYLFSFSMMTHGHDLHISINRFILLFFCFFFVYSSCTFANSCNSNYFIFTVVSRFTFFSFFSFVFSLCSYSLFDYSLSLWMLLSVYVCARWLKGSDRHRIYWYW